MSDESIFDDVLEQTLSELTESTISRLEQELADLQDSYLTLIGMWYDRVEENGRLKKELSDHIDYEEYLKRKYDKNYVASDREDMVD